jgi:RimJ/RimL family protein N-acetyltransferase
VAQASDDSNVTGVETIRTPRLELVSMSVPFMQALQRRDFGVAEREMDASVPRWMPTQLKNFLVYRLAQLERDPTEREWLGRAMVVKDEQGGRHAVGSIGFHGRPDSAGRAEIGYGIDPRYRRQGYTSEAVRAMFDWAHSKHGITRFVASVAPNNRPSLALIRNFGFTRVGEQMDEIDGLEYVFETTWPLVGL